MEGSALLGIVNAGMQAAGNTAIGRDKRAIQRQQNLDRMRHYAQTDKQLALGQENLNREANYANEEVKGDANERGVLNSSIPGAAQNRITMDNQRRVSAIQDQRNALSADKVSEDKVREYANHADKLSRMFALINSAIGGGASGALNQSTQGSLYQGYGA